MPGEVPVRRAGRHSRAMQPVTGRAVTGRAVAGRGAVLRTHGAGQDLLAAWRADPAAVLSAPRFPGAAILIVAADFAAGATSAAGAAVAGRGFAAVIAPEFGQIFCTAVTKGGVFPLCLPIGKVTELQDMVEADPARLLTFDIGNRQVTAGDDFSAEFEIAGRAAGEPPGGKSGAARQARSAGTALPAGGNDHPRTAAESAQLADRIRAVQLHMSSLDMPTDLRMRLQRRLVVMCDAMKAAAADPARCERRLALLAAELDRLTATHGTGDSPNRI